MSKSATVSKLEALLARIRTRAKAPRQPVQPPAVTAASAVRPPPAASPPAAPIAQQRQSPHVAPALAIEEATQTPPPPAMTSDADFAVDVEVSPPTPAPPAMVAPPAQEVHVRAALQARERLPVPASDARGGDGDASGAAPSIEQLEVLADEESLVGDEDDETQEAPASSRRPVVPPPEERLAALAFGAGESEPSRHTPPPKSGPLPSPPVEHSHEVARVREPASISQTEGMPHPVARAVRPSVLAAQTSRPNLGSTESPRMPDLIGAAQSFSPSTFLELLEASLSL